MREGLAYIRCCVRTLDKAGRHTGEGLHGGDPRGTLVPMINRGTSMGASVIVGEDVEAHLKAISMVAALVRLIEDAVGLAAALPSQLAASKATVEALWPSADRGPMIADLFPTADGVRATGLSRAREALMSHARRAFGTQGVELPITDEEESEIWAAAKSESNSRSVAATLESLWVELARRYGGGRGPAKMRAEAARRLLRELHIRHLEGEPYSEAWQPQIERGVVSFRLGLRVSPAYCGEKGYRIDYQYQRLLGTIERDVGVVMNERWLALDGDELAQESGFSLPYRRGVTGGRLVFFKERTLLQIDQERALQLRSAIEAALEAGDG